jgi:hypothetical protein
MHSPPKIKQIRILEDPFGDIIPRITAAEKRAQQLAKEQIQRERAEQGKRKQGRKSVSMDCRRIEANHSSEMQNFCHSAMMPMQMMEFSSRKSHCFELTVCPVFILLFLPHTSANSVLDDPEIGKIPVPPTASSSQSKASVASSSNQASGNLEVCHTLE